MENLSLKEIFHISDTINTRVSDIEAGTSKPDSLPKPKKFPTIASSNEESIVHPRQYWADDDASTHHFDYPILAESEYLGWKKYAENMGERFEPGERNSVFDLVMAGFMEKQGELMRSMGTQGTDLLVSKTSSPKKKSKIGKDCDDEQDTEQKKKPTRTKKKAEINDQDTEKKRKPSRATAAKKAETKDQEFSPQRNKLEELGEEAEAKPRVRGRPKKSVRSAEDEEQ